MDAKEVIPAKDRCEVVSVTGERLAVTADVFYCLRAAFKDKLNGTITIATRNGGICGVSLQAQWNYKPPT